MGSGSRPFHTKASHGSPLCSLPPAPSPRDAAQSRPSLPALNRPPPPPSWTRDPRAVVFPLTIRPSSSRYGPLLPPAGPFYRLVLFNDRMISSYLSKQKRPQFRRTGTSCSTSAPFFLATGRIPPGPSSPFLLPLASYPPRRQARLSSPGPIPSNAPTPVIPRRPGPLPDQTKRRACARLCLCCGDRRAHAGSPPPDPP